MNRNVLSITKLTNMIYRCTQSYINEALKKYELGSGTYPFLLTLYNKEGINQNQISKEINVDKAMSARTVKQLIKLGFIKKVTDPGDSRACNLFLTDKAKAVIPDVKNELRKWNEAITAGMEDNDILNLMGLLSTVLENAKVCKRSEE